MIIIFFCPHFSVVFQYEIYNNLFICLSKHQIPSIIYRHLFTIHLYEATKSSKQNSKCNRFFFNSSIKPERLKILSLLIEDVFPTENESTYYVPYHFDKTLKIKVLPKGKLYDKLNFYRAVLIEAEGTLKLAKKNQRKTIRDYCAWVSEVIWLHHRMV